MNKKEFYYVVLTKKDKITGDIHHNILYYDDCPMVFDKEEKPLMMANIVLNSKNAKTSITNTNIQ